MRRSLLTLTLGFLLAALQPALACAGCAPAQDCCPPGKPMPCGQPQGGQFGEMRACCSSAPTAPIVIATSHKPDAALDHRPDFDGLDTIPTLAVVTQPNWKRSIDLPVFSPDIVEAWGADTYLFTRRLRL